MNKLKRYSLLLAIVASFSFAALGQQLIPLGAFKKPDGLKRDSYNSDVQLVYDWQSNRAIAIERIEKQKAIIVHTFN